jgi:hypothetical protein
MPVILDQDSANILESKPWRRGVYGENMQPLTAPNITASWCKHCGDWIEDSAYSREHRWWHRARRRSWNYENPRNKRRNSDDILPDHEEWLQEMRDWASRVGQYLQVCSINGPMPGRIQAFHSLEEARSILEPFGLEMIFDIDAGFSNDGIHWSGAWLVRPAVAIKEENIVCP